MNETELLELGTALARTSDVLRPGTRAPFCDYLLIVLANHGGEIEDLFGGSVFLVSVDGQVVEGPDSSIPVTATSRVVLYRRQGPALDVLTRGVVRRIWLN